MKTSFRSIPPGFEISFSPDLESASLEPVGLAGLNGSGKSNLLELLSEIFYYLDSLQLDFSSKAIKEEKGIGFEIDYAMPLTNENISIAQNNNKITSNDRYFIVRIIQKVGNKPVYQISSKHEYCTEMNILKHQNYNNNNINIWMAVDENTKYLLPKKVFAYTSGHNELLSNAYYKIQFHYFNEYRDKIKDSNKFYMDSSRLFFSDNLSNASVFVSNYLLGDQARLAVLNDIVKIEKLHSFRITIRYANSKGKEIQLNFDLEMRIDRMKRCATAWFETGEGARKILTLDYLVQEATKEAFKKNFGDTPFDLYNTFYEMEMLNFHAIPTDIIEMVTNGPKWLNITDELPKPDPSNLLFRIEQIRVCKEEIPEPIFYKGLSDGEHQFLQIVGMVMMMEESGCLFLFDEPGTHYNPLWRSKLVNTLNKVASYNTSNNNEKTRLQEIVITTHSPFVLSDMRKRNVFVFNKNGYKLEYSECPIETYGTSAGIILDVIFGKKDAISDKAKSEIDELCQDITTMEDIRRVADQLNTRFGDSVAKLDKFSLLNKLEGDK
ncbi:MAG: restriction system-associated AAA family ATPase [Chitinophagaceae bacterium]|nr:restriction system-associated AAA family ATPase [Chitinophagaceae bacterium]